MEIQPMSHLQPCKWLMCHGSFSRRSKENWEFGGKHLEMFAARQGRDCVGGNVGSVECLWGEGAQSTPGTGL